MPDDPKHDDGPDLPDPDTVYAKYLETCRRAGVKPVSRDKAHNLTGEWSEVIVGRLPPPPTRH